MKKLFALLALVATAMPSAALSAPGTTLYDIEVLVFENRQAGLEGGEVWRETTKEIAKLDQAALPEGAPEPDSTLSQAAAALERGGQYRILIHRHWQQAAEPKAASVPLRLQSAGRELDGMVRFYLSRFLYVEMNLVLQGAGEAYPLTEHRRVRPQETHYFDHPRLGALVRVTVVGKSEAPKPAPPVKPSR